MEIKGCFQRIISGYGALLFKILSFILIFVLCLGLSFLIVYPLWFSAVNHPRIYTAIAICILAGSLLYFFIKRQIKKYKQNRGRFFHTLFKRCIVLIGCGLCISSLIYFDYTAALAVLVISALLYGFAAYGYPQDSFHHS